MRNQSVTVDSELGHDDTAKVPSRNKDSELAMRLRDMLGNESVTAFGRRCGIGEATLRKYFSGTLPNSENLVAIADAANVNIEWLAAGRGPKMRGASGPTLVPAPTTAPVEAEPPFVFADLARMEMAIDVVQEALFRTGRKFPPDKHAKIISLAYQLLENAEQRDTVAAMIQMAA